MSISRMSLGGAQGAADRSKRGEAARAAGPSVEVLTRAVVLIEQLVGPSLTGCAAHTSATSNAGRINSRSTAFRRSRWWKFLDKHFPPRPDFLLGKIPWGNFHCRNQWGNFHDRSQFVGFLSAKVLQFDGSLFWNTLGELLRRHGKAPEIDRKDGISVMVELARCQKGAERKFRK